MALQKIEELENFLSLMEKDVNFDAFQLQLIQQFRTFVETNEDLVANDIEIHAKGLRKHEADTEFYKTMLIDSIHELNDKQKIFFDVLCRYMSQDNIVVISFSTVSQIISIQRRQYFNIISQLEQLGYICKLPNKELLLNKNDGTVIMVNPLFATKSHDTTQITNYFMKHANHIAIAKLKQRLNNIKVEFDQVNVGSALVKNHKLRYNKIGITTKKTSAAISKSDVSNNSNNIIAQNTQNVQAGTN